MNQSQQLRMTVYAALFAALIAAGAYIAIPVGPVPIILQNFFVMLAGLLLGRRWGAGCVGLYLLAGALGLPVFAGGTGGIGRILGPTGGYLLSYLPAVWLIGLLAEKGGSRVLFDCIALVCGALVVYAGGVGWLKMLSGLSWPKAISAGMFVFLPGDAVKIAAALPIARTLRPVIAGALLDTGDTRGHH